MNAFVRHQLQNVNRLLDRWMEKRSGEVRPPEDIEMTEDIRSAIEREKQIKSWNRARKEALVESQNPIWEDQYPMILQG